MFWCVLIILGGFCWKIERNRHRSNYNGITEIPCTNRSGNRRGSGENQMSPNLEGVHPVHRFQNVGKHIIQHIFGDFWVCSDLNLQPPPLCVYTNNNILYIQNQFFQANPNFRSASIISIPLFYDLTSSIVSSTMCQHFHQILSHFQQREADENQSIIGKELWLTQCLFSSGIKGYLHWKKFSICILKSTCTMVLGCSILFLSK